MPTSLIPVTLAERTPNGNYMARCTACPAWHGPRHKSAGSAYLDGDEHKRTVHGAGEKR